jgi:hypothetical protein
MYICECNTVSFYLVYWIVFYFVDIIFEYDFDLYVWLDIKL